MRSNQGAVDLTDGHFRLTLSTPAHHHHCEPCGRQVDIFPCLYVLYEIVKQRFRSCQVNMPHYWHLSAKKQINNVNKSIMLLIILILLLLLTILILLTYLWDYLLLDIIRFRFTPKLTPILSIQGNYKVFDRFQLIQAFFLLDFDCDFVNNLLWESLFS